MPNPSELVEEFFLYLRHKNSSPHTISSYRRDIVAFVVFVNKLRSDILDINHQHVRAFLVQRGDHRWILRGGWRMSGAAYVGERADPYA